MSIKNNCTFIGNLVEEPKTRDIGSAESVQCLDSSIAINRKFKNRQGQVVEETDFIPFVAYGKASELIAKHTSKGHQIALQGEMRLEKWQDKETGGNRSKLKLRVENFQFLNNK